MSELPSFTQILISFHFAAGPLCTEDSFPTYSNTQYTKDTTTACHTVTYTCTSNYEFSDGSTSNSLTCKGGFNTDKDAGTWDGNIPDCVGKETHC